MKPKVGQYFYQPHGHGFRIYRWTFVSAESCSASRVEDEPTYYDREEAHKRVYKLNGWNFNKKKNGRTASSPAR